ncbi:MAG: GPW/gp25 family protein [Burkholderiaceae bacterium]
MTEFLGVGWGFPITRDGEDRFVQAAFEACVAQSIRVILGTGRGERVMRPDFGCGLQDLVFATASDATLGTAESEVREALRRWEPRIELLSVTASLMGARQNGLLISVDYRIQSSDNRYNLVYPFYLDRGAS